LSRSSAERAVVGSYRAMRMRQSLSQFEAAFREETVEDRARRERLRAEAARRSYQRRQQRVVRHSTARFVMLVLTIIGTTVLVTVVMFQMLALWFA
jgi:hypothetical protein